MSIGSTLAGRLDDRRCDCGRRIGSRPPSHALSDAIELRGDPLPIVGRVALAARQRRHRDPVVADHLGVVERLLRARSRSVSIAMWADGAVRPFCLQAGRGTPPRCGCSSRRTRLPCSRSSRAWPACPRGRCSPGRARVYNWIPMRSSRFPAANVRGSALTIRLSATTAAVAAPIEARNVRRSRVIPL